MKILVRLPNWLGDVVMSTAFMNALQEQCKEAEINVIIKKGLEQLVGFMPGIKQVFIFDKKEYKGLKGMWQFGKVIAAYRKYDLFICLPDSFSSAFIGYATRAKQRIGYANEGRSLLFTKAYKKPCGLHRAETYVYLLEKLIDKKITSSVSLVIGNCVGRKNIIININSEASSRRLPANKAASLIDALACSTNENLILIGATKESEFVQTVYLKLKHKNKIQNMAGQTNLLQLINLISSAKAMVSTDSGPAHIANACNTPLLVLFGAGNETKTAPYNKKNLSVVRLGQLPCEPCEKNICKFGQPICLLRLDEEVIIKNFLTLLNNENIKHDIA